MIERKTVIDKIEIDRDGMIGLRLAKLLVENGKELSCQWHRSGIEPGGDVDAQFALINAHLKQIGEAAVESDRLTEVKALVGVVHTPELVKRYRAEVERREQLAAAAE